MKALSVTSNGQITLRKELLQHLGVQPGDKLSIEKRPGGKLQLSAAQLPGKIEDFFGSLKRGGQKPTSIEEMNAAIAAGRPREP